MAFFLVTFVLVTCTDGQTDRRRRIRANHAWAQVGSKTGQTMHNTSTSNTAESVRKSNKNAVFEDGWKYICMYHWASATWAILTQIITTESKPSCVSLELLGFGFGQLLVSVWIQIGFNLVLESFWFGIGSMHAPSLLAIIKQS